MKTNQAHDGSHESGPELTTYLLGEASAEERRRIEEHLATCATCRRELALLEATVKAVSRIDSEELMLDAPARDRVLAAAAGTSGPGSDGRPEGPAPTARILKLAGALTALAASVLALVVILHETGTDAGAPAAGERRGMLAIKDATRPAPAADGAGLGTAGRELDRYGIDSLADGDRRGIAGDDGAAGSRASDAPVAAEKAHILSLMRDLKTEELARQPEDTTLAASARLRIESNKIETEQMVARFATPGSGSGSESRAGIVNGAGPGAPAARQEHLAESRSRRLYGRSATQTAVPETIVPGGPVHEGKKATSPPARRPNTEAAPPPKAGAPATREVESLGIGGGGGRGVPRSQASRARRGLGEPPATKGADAGAPTGGTRGKTLLFKLAAERKTADLPDDARTPPAASGGNGNSGKNVEQGDALRDKLSALGYIDGARGSAEEEEGDDDGEIDEAALLPEERHERLRAEVRQRIEAIYAGLARRPGESPTDMFFRYWGDNPFVETRNDPLSTFAVDVDTASYTLARSYLTAGQLPPPEMVRTEEFVNYFKSKLEAPASGTFRIHAQLAPDRFAHEAGYQMLKVGLKGREISRSERQACALTFVVDVSGSMRQGGRLELVKEALRLLVEQLDEGDSIGIAAFNTNGFEVLQPTAASNKEAILTKIASLSPGGSTNAGEGLQLGYAMASRQLQKGANNRVILCSDGVANTGVTDQQAILGRVDEFRRQGVLLTCVGVGMGNHNDVFLEQLADKGDGQCFYVDRPAEARRVFVDELTGTLQTIARDVKIQVAFDPDRVIRYRLLGYENRDVADRDFRNDAVDAGEVGAGHEVVALYELKCRPEASGPVATIRVRYKDVEIPAEVTEIERTVTWDELVESVDAATPRFQLSTVAAEFAELLRGSYWAAGSSFDALSPIVDRIAQNLPGDESVAELAALVRQARDLKAAVPDDLARALDEVMKTNYQIALVESGRSPAEASGAIDRRSEQEQIEELRHRNQALRERLEEILLARLAR